MEKEKYEPIEIEVIVFDSPDVIDASPLDNESELI